MCVLCSSILAPSSLVVSSISVARSARMMGPSVILSVVAPSRSRASMFTKLLVDRYFSTILVHVGVSESGLKASFLTSISHDPQDVRRVKFAKSATAGEADVVTRRIIERVLGKLGMDEWIDQDPGHFFKQIISSVEE